MSRSLKPLEDYCKVEKREKKEKEYKPKRVYRKVKNNINIPPVISRYKNPTSELVPLELRRKTGDTEIINYKKFIDFNKCLDQIEELCKKKNRELE
ncbi:uncharacterized protein VNE69_11038 [Vairimorpha necatrix]|uniref:Uncharacterized protein n=1 Tax=Vairimorpha necatrix TaxID=6039 RepID=A0AAX4JG68_9MICR